MIAQPPVNWITFLKTRDLQATTHFYRDLLGFRLVLDQARCRIFQVVGQAHLGFCLTEGPTGSDEVILTLEIEDVDGYCAYLEGRGVAIEIRPRFNPDYQIYQMFIRDPNRYRVEIQRFIDPAWSESHKLD